MARHLQYSIKAIIMRKRILIVDDESLILLVLSKLLAAEGTEITTVTNGKDALREIAAHHYDLCLLDVYLPDLNGVDIMQRIKDISPHTKVAIMSGSYLDHSVRRVIKENAFCFISKPFELSEVKAMAGRALEAAPLAH